MKKCHLSYYRSISKSTDDIFEMAYREARLLKSIHHLNVIQCLDYFIDGSYLCMILEYMPSGDLEDFIDYFKRNEQLIPEKVILQILRDCMYGLQCLHSQSVVHRDIKPQNLFLRDGRVKIGDLGVAATFTASTGQQTCTGTVQYMAPEMIKGEPYAFSADIWSLGCVAYEMMWRKPLFNKGSYSELVTQIIEQRNPVVVSFPGIYSQKLCDVVLSMLNVSKDARPCDEEILTVIQVFVLNQRNY
ncbi:protein kinase [Blastocystis sp. subtype 4]|uniref:protein kinase n=1 Tax=Blastocystis sp. subtype 4 TaxID=944170 RepID=UPI000712133A|nr:protein kinase [Blastocystis sp. subtype 4]KNB44918.1 protein kinase [Blastocystis sp. subtype 4]|eukprot:XP_014528361.1 protein kinase [Blastocystis sp. subtype 4]